MARSRDRNNSNSESTSGAKHSETPKNAAPSQGTNTNNSRPANTGTGSIIQRVSNPSTGQRYRGASETPQAHRGSEEGGTPYQPTPDAAAEGARQANANEALRRQAEQAARRAEQRRPHTAREQFKKSEPTKALTKKPAEERVDKRPHCMPKPKRGKTRGAGGKSKGFVPFC